MTTTVEQLRTMVRGSYDLQKLRIQTGNRIVANFRAKLGQTPGTSEEALEKDAQLILKKLRDSYKKIMDGILATPKPRGFQGDEVINDFTEFCLVSQYMELDRTEAEHFGRLKHVLNDFPLWTGYLKNILGVGPTMAGVILSEFDIHKAQYASSLWKYAGLDVVQSWELLAIQKTRGTAPEDLIKKIPEVLGMEFQTETPLDRTLDTEININNQEDEMLIGFRAPEWAITAVYHKVGKGRSRSKEHLIKIAYINKDGEEAVRNGISFNPFLKAKLVGVLGVSFLRAGAAKKGLPPGEVISPAVGYRRVYDDYKHRLENDPRKKDWTKGHIHNASIRYMIKIFLADLYEHWRPLEGLEAHKPYHEAKLGRAPHGQDKLSGTVTGLSPRGPNLQNIPMRTEEASKIRKAFTGED